MVRAPVDEAAAPLTVRTVPEVVTSIVPVAPSLMVKLRSVLTLEPVYLSVPPLITKFEASLVDAPIELFEPPLARVPTLSVPPLIVVAPV